MQDKRRKLSGGGAEQLSDLFAALPDPAQLPGAAISLRWASAPLVFLWFALLFFLLSPGLLIL